MGSSVFIPFFLQVEIVESTHTESMQWAGTCLWILSTHRDLIKKWPSLHQYVIHWASKHQPGADVPEKVPCHVHLPETTACKVPKCTGVCKLVLPRTARVPALTRIIGRDGPNRFKTNYSF